MSNFDIVRAWKDQDYLESLSEEWLCNCTNIRRVMGLKTSS